MHKRGARASAHARAAIALARSAISALVRQGGADTPPPQASSPAPQPPDDAPLIAAEEILAADAEATSLSWPRRFVKALGKQPAWVVAAILTGAISQIEVHAFDPVAHGIVAGYRAVTGQQPLGTPNEQMNKIAGQAKDDGYTVTSTSVAFAFGPKAEVLVLSPRDPASSTHSAELRVYAVPTKGRVRKLFDFRPQPASSGRTLPGSPLTHLFFPRTFGMRVRATANVDGSPGNEVLVDLFDPREPSMAVIPLLLSQDLSNDKLVLRPLLSPTSTGKSSMVPLLSAKRFAAGDWAIEARTSLYGRPIAISTGAHGKRPIESFAVAAYAFSNAALYGTSGGVLTLATGYVARGGNFPTPSLMQILIWHVDLTAPSPNGSAKTFAGIPDFAAFPPSATARQIQAALTAAVHGLPSVTHSSSP